ncbi:MAG: 30S ribosomal protein S7 [Verrucomicrobiae bacterium]|nr:30S ribosomal protein S7 [Verrucomicrobiae bacterium]
MARRRKAEKREMLPDHRYGDPLVARLISTVMRCGKKSVAERIVYQAIDLANKGHEGVEADPLIVFRKAIDTIKPRVEVRARRVGGATYQVPSEVPVERQTSLAIRWIVMFAQKRKGVPMARALANELRDAAGGQGGAVKKRDDVHKMAQANKAFAHFRW